MSDASGGLGSGTDATQGTTARANQDRTGFGSLTGPRSGRDVSRPWPATMKRGSSTHDQATGGRP